MNFTDNINSIYKKSYEFLSNIFSNIKDLLLTILDIIVNGIETNEDKFKYYRYFITALIIIILGLFYYLNEKQNLFKIKDTKYEILTSVIMIGISIYLFLFFVYRNNTKWDNVSGYNTNYNTNYNNLTRKFIEKKNESKKINNEKLKNSLTFPLGNMFKYLSILFLCVIVPLILINYILYIHKDNNSIFNITQSILGFFIIIVIFAIIAKVFSIQSNNTSDCNKLKEEENFFEYILCIIKNIIFFIPCLLVIIVDEINKDIKLTPSSVYILFFILLILITIIFLLPLLFKYIRSNNKSDILSGEGPYYLNQKRTLGKYQNLNKNIGNIVNLPTFETSIKDPLEKKLDNLMETLKIDKNNLNIFNNKKSLEENNLSIDDENNKNNKNNKNNNIENSKSSKFKLFQNDLNGVYNIETNYYNPEKGKNKFPYNYTYSISFYIYINPQPTNTSLAYSKDTELFNYGFKPVIYYNGKSRKIIIKSRTINNKGDQLDTIYETSNIKHQKWLYFVINYDNNIIDIFIDGKLVGSKNNVTPYFKGDIVTIGEQDGIHGSIKEIYYYDKIKTPDSIQFLYNLTKNKK